MTCLKLILPTKTLLIEEILNIFNLFLVNNSNPNSILEGGHGLTDDITSNIVDLLEYRKMASWAEDEIGRKWDRCFTDVLIKFGGGIVLGGVFSLFFFKRRKWPIITGAGFGVGMAYANCQEELNSTIRQQLPKDCSKLVDGQEKKAK